MNYSRNNFRNFLDLQFIIEQMYFMQFIQNQAIQHCFFGISLVPHSSISLSTYKKKYWIVKVNHYVFQFTINETEQLSFISDSYLSLIILQILLYSCNLIIS